MHAVGQKGNHLGRYAVRHVGHDGIEPPQLEECVQLIFDIFRLLPGEARYIVITAKPLRGNTVASCAIFEFPLKGARGRANAIDSGAICLRARTMGSGLGLTGGDRQKNGQRRPQPHAQMNSFHIPGLPASSF